MGKTRTCKKCGEEISAKYAICPQCKYPNFAKPASWLIPILIGLFFCVVFMFVKGFGDKKDSTAYTQKPQDESEYQAQLNAIQISAVQLSKEYGENEVRADKLYKGQYLMVTGTVENINVSMGKTCVYLEGIQTMYYIGCNTRSDSEVDKIAYFKKGDRVSVYGTCTGDTLGTVFLNSCSFILLNR